VKGKFVVVALTSLGLPAFSGAWVVYSTDFTGGTYASLGTGQYLAYYADGTVGAVDGGWTGTAGTLGDGWTVLGASGSHGSGTTGVSLVSTMKGVPATADGSQWMDLTGAGGAGGIERTFSLHAGNSYTVTWNQFVTAGTGRSADLEVVKFGPMMSLMISTGTSTGWTTESLTFTSKTTGTGTLAFNSTGGGTVGIGDVTLADPGKAVPEPLTLSFAACALGLAAHRRKRRA
jgi:hypothetical protein